MPFLAGGFSEPFLDDSVTTACCVYLASASEYRAAVLMLVYSIEKKRAARLVRVRYVFWLVVQLGILFVTVFVCCALCCFWPESRRVLLLVFVLVRGSCETEETQGRCLVPVE